MKQRCQQAGQHGKEGFKYLMGEEGALSHYFCPLKKGIKKGFEACIMVVLILGQEEILLLSGGK